MTRQRPLVIALALVAGCGSSDPDTSSDTSPAGTGGASTGGSGALAGHGGASGTHGGAGGAGHAGAGASSGSGGAHGGKGGSSTGGGGSSSGSAGKGGSSASGGAAMSAGGSPGGAGGSHFGTGGVAGSGGGGHAGTSSGSGGSFSGIGGSSAGSGGSTAGGGGSLVGAGGVGGSAGTAGANGGSSGAGLAGGAGTGGAGLAGGSGMGGAGAPGTGGSTAAGGTSGGGSSGGAGGTLGGGGVGGKGGTAGSTASGGTSGAAGSSGVPGCDAPASPPSLGACGAAFPCNPVTNAGCDGANGEACDYVVATKTFACLPPPSDLSVCATGCNASEHCIGGAHCFLSTVCARFCCGDGDCGTGFCRTDVTGFSGAAAGVGICQTTPQGSAGPSKIASGAYTLVGVTSDDWVIAIASSGTGITAFPLSGAAPVVLDAQATAVEIHGRVVVTWRKNGFSPTLWTSTTTPWVFEPRALQVVAVTTDGAHAVYVASTDGKTGTVKRLDVATSTTHVVGYPVDTTQVPAVLGATADRLLSLAEPTSGTSGVLHSFDAATGAGVILSSAAGDFLAIAPDGQHVLYSDAPKPNLHVVSTVGGNDIATPWGFGSAAVFLPDSLHFVFKGGNQTVPDYTTGGMIAGLFNTTFPPNNSDYPLAASPNGKWVLFTSGDATTPGSLVLGDTTAFTETSNLFSFTSAVFGDAFTSDSSHLLYFDNVDLSTGTGDFAVLATPNGAAKTLGTKGWLAYAGKGAKAVWNDNWVAGVGNGTTTIHSIDLAGNGAATDVAIGADAWFYLTAAKDRIVFATEQAPTAGIWVTPVP